MCGIVGYIGRNEAVDKILEGLRQVEYRGYDSAGMVVFNSKPHLYRSVGEIQHLSNVVKKVDAHSGIGHTRWATHGKPSIENAHPHYSGNGKVFVVHNGILENFEELKEELSDHVFYSETDSEVIPNLIAQNFKGNLVEDVISTVSTFKGNYAIAVSIDDKEIVVSKKGSPIVIGIGDGYNMVASDVNALIDIDRGIFLDDGETARITKDGIEVFNSNNKLINKEVIKLLHHQYSKKNDQYEHYMLQEVMEQPDVLRNILEKKDEILSLLKNVDFNKKIHVVACGSSWHAGIVFKYLCSKFLSVEVNVEVASEFRYREPNISKDDLVIGISQSGETADTLACMQLAKSKGAYLLSLVNVSESTIDRISDTTLYLNAGVEVGVASTKAFFAQLVLLYLLVEYMGGGKVDFSGSLKKLPGVLDQFLSNLDLTDALEVIKDSIGVLFVGRLENYPIALEGALKLKELSYIHAQGCSAGELKHGTLALVDATIPTIAIATDSHVLDKSASNIAEIQARDGRVIAIVTEGNTKIHADVKIEVPKLDDYLYPLINVIPMQLLAYYDAKNRGNNVDKPRNLAKSVTVE